MKRMVSHRSYDQSESQGTSLLGQAALVVPPKQPRATTKVECLASSVTNAPEDTFSVFAELLRGYYGASVCVIVIREPHSADSVIYRADENPTAAVRGLRVGADLARLLLGRSNEPLVFRRRRTAGAASRHGCEARSIEDAELEELANLLESDLLTSWPLRAKGFDLGRLYLGSRRAPPGGPSLCSVATLSHVTGVIETMLRGSRVASEVVCEERKRISRDLHDSTVQPYIGLKLGLEALRRRVGEMDELAREVDELISMATDGIGELRQYVGTLENRGIAKKKHADGLLPSLLRQAHKFTEFYGIQVHVVAERDISVTAVMQDELIHIAREGLSNIRRHTSARQATVSLKEQNGRLRLEFANPNPVADSVTSDFYPRSIGERASELGGSVTVRNADGCTLVCVDLPL